AFKSSSFDWNMSACDFTILMPLDAERDRPRLDFRCLTAAMLRLCARLFDESLARMIHQRAPCTGVRPCFRETPWRKGIPRLNSGADICLVALRIQRARTRGARADVRTRRGASPRRLSPRHLLQEARGPSATRGRSGSSRSEERRVGKE